VRINATGPYRKSMDFAILLSITLSFHGPSFEITKTSFLPEPFQGTSK
jgi:hypothetical protein